MEKVVAVAVAAGVTPAILCTPAEVAGWRAQGVRLFFLQSDYGLLRAAAQNAVATAAEAVAAHG
jgi:2-keto-3-deoxy-L-rhamnonate aldolase RhmA